MKKIILTLVVFISSLVYTSCITPYEAEYVTIGYNDIYVYSGISYPVYYVDHIAYYWSVDRWLIVPTFNYHLIRHFDNPRYFSGYHPKRQVSIYNRRPHTRHSIERRPGNFRRNDIRKNQRLMNERLNRPNSRINQRQIQRIEPRSTQQSRPQNRPQTRPNINRSNGGNFGGRR